MTAVRCYFLDGLALQAGNPGLKLPYIGRSILAAEPLTPTTSDPAPNRTEWVLVQIPKDCAVLFELNPPNREQPADRNSPLMEAGDHILKCGPGWTVSALDAD